MYALESARIYIYLFVNIFSECCIFSISFVFIGIYVIPVVPTSSSQVRLELVLVIVVKT